MKRCVLHVISTWEAGGVQLRTCELLPALGDDLRHVAVSLDDGRTDARALPGGAAWHAVEQLPKAGSLRTTARLRAVLARRRPCLVATYDWGALDALVANALGPRLPHLHHEDGITADERDGVERRRALARRAALRWTDRVVVPSLALEARARERWRVPSAKLIRIPNGVDTTRFAPRSARGLRTGLAIDAAAPLVGVVGRLSPVKNVARALRAVAGLRSAPAPHLVVAGDGPERAALGALASELGIAARVHWLGFLPDPGPLHAELDVFLLPSDHEEHPRALLEAMASGRAVVATDVGDVRALLPAGQHPYVVPLDGARTCASLTAGLARLLERVDERETLGRENRARALAAYDVATMHARYAQLYRELLARGGC